MASQKNQALVALNSTIAKTQKLKKYYDTLALLDELQGLEKQFSRLGAKLLPYYSSLLTRSEEYAEYVSSSQEKMVLQYMNAAIFSRIYHLKTKGEASIIIDLENYLTLANKNIKELGKLMEKDNKRKAVEFYTETYKSNIDKKVTEAQYFIGNQILPELSSNIKEVEEKIHSLINETKALRDDAKADKQRLQKARDQLAKSLVARWVLRGIELLSPVMERFGAYGKVLGAITSTAASAANNQLLSSAKKDIKEIVKKYPDNKELIKKGGKVVFDYIKAQYKEDKDQKKELNDAIQKASKEIARLEENLNGIYTTIYNLENDIINAANNMDIKSQIGLEVAKWQIQKILRDAKTQFVQLSEGFSLQPFLTRSIEKLEETLTTLINVYDKIQTYQDQQQLASYISNIALADNTQFANQEFSNAINDLEIIIRSNLILEQRKNALNALTQQMFPMAYLYLDDCRQVPNFQQDNGFELLLAYAVQQTEGLQIKLKEYKASITKSDKFINNGYFNSDYKSTQPFFIWDNENHKDAICKILAGEKVALKADISNSNQDKDAIKFSQIGLHFNSNYVNVAKELARKLEGFSVEATHLGNSYYRCNGTTYLITSDSQTIKFSFEKDKSGEPVIKNSVYQKLQSGDLTLSPYAMWEIQLIDDYKKEVDFEDLLVYKDIVDLELVGYGSYLASNANVPHANVDYYYKMAEQN